MENFKILSRRIVEIIQSVHNKTNGKVRLEIRKMSVPGMDRFAVGFRVQGNPTYWSHMFYYWPDQSGNALIIDYGEERKLIKTVEALETEFKSFVNSTNMKASISALQEFADSTITKISGVVKTIAPDTFAANDFLVEVTETEFNKIEEHINSDENPFEIFVNEAPTDGIPTRYINQIASSYKFLEIQGLVVHIESIKRRNGVLNITVDHVELPGLNF